MASLLPNNFASYELTEQELENGTLLTVNQKMVLQNKLSEIATQKINLVFNPSDVADYSQQTAYLQAQLDTINWMLDSSSSMEEVLKAKLNYVRATEQDTSNDSQSA
jgi:hypothetical protein